MENFSFTTIAKAGKLTESDNVLTMIQGLAMDQAQGVATWLSLATGCNVHIRRISPFGETEIEIDYEQEIARMKQEHGNPQGFFVGSV